MSGLQRLRQGYPKHHSPGATRGLKDHLNLFVDVVSKLHMGDQWRREL